MSKIAVVVVTYNRLEMLKRCIHALREQTYNCDILIVDNSSTDGTEEWIINNNFNSKVLYFNTGSNIGGAGGFNYGIKKAMSNNYDFVWLMDDDCIPNEDALEKLMLANDKLGIGNYGYLSSVVLWTDGTECKMNRQKYKNHIVKTSNCNVDKMINVNQSTFVSLLLPKETIYKVGLPIKEFFIWGDDIEYTRRITVREKIPSYMICDSVVIHEMKENNGSSIALDNIDRIDRYEYAYRNECYLYKKEGIKGFSYYLMKCFFNLIRIVTKSKIQKTRRIFVVVSGMLKGLWFKPKIEKVCKEDKWLQE